MNMPVDSNDFGDPPPFIRHIRSGSKHGTVNGTLSNRFDDSQSRVTTATAEDLIESASTRAVNHKRRTCSHMNQSTEVRRRRSLEYKNNYKNTHVNDKSIQTNNNNEIWNDEMTSPADRNSSTAGPPQKRTPPGAVASFYIRNYLDLPITDYTYSPLSLFHRRDISPGIPTLPVLSRRGDSTSFAASGYSSQRSLFPEESYEQVNWWRRTVTTVVTTISTIVFYVLSSVQTSNESLLYPWRTRSRFEDRSHSKIRWIFLLLLLLLLYYFLSSANDEGHVDTGSSDLIDAANSALNCTIWSLEYAKNFIGGVLSAASSAIFGVFAYLSSFTNAQQSVTPRNEIVQVLDTVTLVERNKEVELDSHSDIARLNEMKQIIASAISQNNLSLLQQMTKDIDLVVARLETIESHFKALETRMANTQSNYLAMKSDVDSGANKKALMTSNPDNITIEMIKSMLETYHADRTGRPDFALQSNGGAIVGVRCTKTYKKHEPEVSYFNIPWFFPYNGPETIIKPGIMPGECWAFEGAEGYVDIELAMPVYITAFTLEHTPKVLTPRNDISSAPKRFSVWGIDSLKDDEMVSLGRFEFKDNGESMQTFNAVPVEKPYKLIELKIESNHGNLDYTCLYRFRVHGQPLA